MSCEELREFYELYALGTAEAEERREIQEHLGRRCPVCVPGVGEARWLAAALALAAPAVDPPARLRRRVLALVAEVPESKAAISWAARGWALAAVVMMAVALWTWSAEQHRRAEIAALDQRLAETRAANDELSGQNRLLSQALALLRLPDATQLVFGQPAAQPPRGRVWVHPAQGVLLLASRLPAAPPGKTYEMWIVPKKGSPAPAGLFNSDARGEALHVWAGPVEIAAAAAVAVTLEPAGGAPAPTTQPLIVAAF